MKTGKNSDCLIPMKKEVKYLGVTVGYSYDGQTIEFLDNKEAQQIKDYLIKGNNIGISSRQTGIIDENNKISDSEIIEYSIMKL